MLSFHTLYIILPLYFSNVFTTVLNIEELNSIHYNIDIVNNPVLKDQEWTTDIVTITNKHGQEYICTLPEVQIPENENKKEEDLLDQLVDISELLKPMEAAPCLIKKKDWWSYEFCYGSVIKQYHLEDNKVVGTILILGKYESEYNWRNNTKSKNKLQKFHTQHYVNGTRCDITGEARRAEVRFHCEEGVGDYIQQVDEPESCRYVIIIATTRVCHHPYLKPNPNRTPHNINCAPALTQDEFEHYQKLQEMKKSKLEREYLLRLAEKGLPDQSFPGEEPTSGSGDFVGESDNARKDSPVAEEEEEESRFSIRLVTIPIPKNRGTRNIKSEINGLLSEHSIGEDGSVPPDEDSLESVSSVADSSYEDLVESDDVHSEDEQGFGSAKSYISVNKLLKKEFVEMFKDREAKKTGDKDENEEKQELKSMDVQELKEEGKRQNVKQQFEAFRNQVNRLARDWMENQNGNRIQELLEKIKQSLDENIQQLQETVNEYSESSIFSYVEDLVEMTEKYKKLPKAEDFDLADEEKVTEALQSMAALLSEAELEVLRAIRKMKFDRMEKYLEAHLRQTGGGGGKSEELPLAGTEERDATPNDGSSSFLPDSPPQLPPFSAHPHPAPTPSRNRVEGQTEAEGEEGSQIADHEKNAAIEETKSDPRHVRILNEKSLDDDRKTRLEQSIKERLEKSGLDNIGRKIEVKILTPNYLDDDEKDNLSSLSQEETEAFHNMIVNILSASAEEMKERERHRNLELSYNFRLDDAEVVAEEVLPSSDDAEELYTESQPIETPSDDSDINDNDSIKDGLD